MSAVRKFRVPPATVRAVTRRHVLRQLTWQLPVLMAAAFIGAMCTRTQDDTSDLTLPLLVLAAIACLTLAAALVLGLVRARKAWSSLELTVSPNVLRLQMADLAPVEVLRIEVTRILELENVGLLLHTTDPRKSPLVSRHLEGFAELRAHLASWRPLDAPPSPGRDRAKTFAWSGAMLAAWLAAGVVSNLVVAAVSGAALIVMGSVTLNGILLSKTLSNRYKASALVTLVLFMLGPVARLFLHFFLNGQGARS